MGVILKPTKRAKERILIYGGGGTGKTYDALTVAHRTLGSGQTLWVLDTDNSVTTLLEEIDTFAGLGIAFDGHWDGRGWEHDKEYFVCATYRKVKGGCSSHQIRNVVVEEL